MTENNPEKPETTKAPTTDTVQEELNKEPQKLKLPPLEENARRLERLLANSSNLGFGSSVSSSSSSSSTKEIATSYSNPVKVVRRWLSATTVNGFSPTIADIKNCTTKLFDPSSDCSQEITLALQGLDTEQTSAPTDMETDTDKAEVKYLDLAAYEVHIWIITLLIRILYREKNFTKAIEISRHSLTSLQSYLSNLKYPQTSLYPLLARLYRYHCLVAEAIPQTSYATNDSLISAHRVACLQYDIDTQSTLLNLLLRSLISQNQIEQAQKLLSNSSFPETASNNQTCRYLYYSGRIQALRLEYTTSYSNLSTCLRKAPTSPNVKGIVGFRIEVTRLLTIVQLLMGDIPSRSVFTPYKELTPYLKLTQAVRKGDLKVFNATVTEYRTNFQQDAMLTLISRLEHSVVKAGLRKLYLSYSRISLQDIATRLALPSTTTAEFIVAKAIKDGVIDATINHEEAYVYSHDTTDIYASMEPSNAFHRRIAYCLTMHNDAIRGMRFLPDAYKKTLEVASGKDKGEEEKTDEEKAKELEEEFEEDF